MSEGKKILVVDDDSVTLKTMEYLLKSFGYSPVVVSSGPEALAVLSDSIQMVVLDVMMPDMDGFEVARRIREHQRFGDMPIIMVTGLTSKEDRLAAIQAGANDFVSKPLDKVELEIRIACHLKLKDAQDKRRESDSRYRVLVENSPVGILCCNPSGQITEINAAAANLFELPPADPGHTHNLLQNPELVPPGVADFVKSCLATGQVMVKEFPAGKQRDKQARLYCAPLRDSDGMVKGLQVVAEDVSDRKRAEELARRGTRLKAFAEMARSAARHFSEAMENIRAELVTALMETDPDAHREVKASLENIRAATQRASQSLTLLEKFARGYSKRDSPNWTTFDFSQTVRDAIAANEPLWKNHSASRGRELQIECDLVDECFVEGEKNDLVELASHLIRNAAEAMPAGGKMKVHTFRQGDRVVLEVHDEGVGMTQEEMRQVGYPFWTSKESHAGLGLAVSCGIIRRHFGNFSITSKKGRGTTFTVKFPLTSRRREIQDTTLELRASHPKVLFVDPDQTVSRNFAPELSGKGPVYFARSIEEAIQIVHEKNIDAIVCGPPLQASSIAELSDRVSVFCASKGTVRPPFILLAHAGRSDLREKSFSEVYIDRIVPSTIDLTDLMLSVSQEVRSASSRPRIAGTVGQIDILDVVQMMVLSGQHLVLEIMSQEGRRGLLYISGGEISHASSAELEGEDAAYWALGVTSGYFSTLPWERPERTTIDMPGDVLLLEAARRRDEIGEATDDDDG